MAIAFIWNCVSPGIKSTRAVGMATAMAAIEPELASIHCVNPLHKSQHGMVGLAQIHELSARLRVRGPQLCKAQAAQEGHEPSRSQQISASPRL